MDLDKIHYGAACKAFSEKNKAIAQLYQCVK